MRILGLVIMMLITISSTAQWTLDYGALRSAQLMGMEQINTDDLEFSPAFYYDQIAYVRPGQGGKKDKAIRESYFELSTTDGTPFSIINEVNEHIGPMSLDEKNNVLYFTQSKKKKRSRRRPVNQLMTAQLVDGAWVSDGALDFCKEGISYQHPTLSADGQMMIFSSNANKDNAYDLYMTKRINGAWSEPESLSSAINTDANEAFPFLYQDSMLFYSSNRANGLGGYDVYVSIYSAGEWQPSISLGTPINSAADDLGFILDTDGQSGYLSSDRSGGRGKDDIYKITSSTPLLREEESAPLTTTRRELIDMDVVVRSVVDDQPVSAAFVSLIPFADLDVTSTDVSSEENAYLLSIIPKKSDKIQTVVTDSVGRSMVTLASDIDYLLTVQTLGYSPYTVSISGKDRPKELSIAISPIPVEEEMPTPVEKKPMAPEPTPEPVVTPPQPVLPPIEDREILVFDQVYYEYNSSKIRKGSTDQLDRLAQYMLRYPDMRVELTAHTDSRGYRAHNQKLSQRRAEAARDYLTNLGISQSRITAIGRGEDDIRNHCSNGVYCTEKEHEYNRRTEVKVIYD